MTIATIHNTDCEKVLMAFYVGPKVGYVDILHGIQIGRLCLLYEWDERHNRTHIRLRWLPRPGRQPAPDKAEAGA